MSRSISFSSISLGLIILALLFIAGTSHAAWQEVDHGDTDVLRSITAFDEDYVYIVGDSGTAHSSNDGGENWTTQDSGTSENLNGVSTAGDVRLFAVGDNATILRSADKGVSWEIQGTGISFDLNDVHMATTNIGTIVGDNGTILTTGNSGLNWTDQDSEDLDNLNGVWHKTNSNIWVVGDNGTILVSTDSGETWDARLTATVTNFHDITFATDMYGFIVGDDGMVMRTVNSGVTWTEIEVDANGYDLYAVDMLDENNLIIAGENVILVSVDGGATWSQQSFPNDAPTFRDVKYFSESTKWLIGESDDEGIVNIYDGDLPTQPTNLTIIGGTPTHNSEPSFSWDASMDNGEVFYRVDIDGSEWDTSFTTFDLPIALVDGSHTIKVTAIDEAGNTSATAELDFEVVDGGAPELIPGLAVGGLIKSMCTEDAVDVNDPCKAVYFYSASGTRHAFPNEKAYFTWYDNFDDIVEIDSSEMANIPLGSNVTYRPGVKMVKFQTVDTVYVVTANVLRPLASEAIAEALYGDNWNQLIDDISDAFFGNYAFGEEITDEADYDIETQLDLYETIDQVM